MFENQGQQLNGPVIEAAGLRCSYGDFEAVKGVSFHVDAGELFALLGTNGAGKTTTLETLEGHRPPTSGQVRVCGRDPLEDRAAVRRHTGIMLQESGFVGELTVEETVRMGARLTSRKADYREAVERLQLGHRRDVRVSQLSGGERRRLDLAIATLGDPKVLFLDEPTTGLDPESRAQVWQLVRSMVAAGSTVLLTTHYLEEAEALSHRLAIMHEGRIEVTGTLDELLTAHAARIAFDVPEGVGYSELPAVRGTVDGEALRCGRFECRTTALQDDLADVLDWARSRRVVLARLQAKHASLGDVFASVSRTGVGDPPGDPVHTEVA